MTGKYTPERTRKGVTVLRVPDMKVLGLRTKEKHGYDAVIMQVAKKVKEIRTEEKPEVGTEIKFEEIVKAGDRVDVAGTSKGKGFAGVVKRHHFKGGPRTHGQSNKERSPGSSGQTTTPGRVYRGKRRAGHMGNERVTMPGLKVLEVDAEKKLITVIGSVPGPAGHAILEVTV